MDGSLPDGALSPETYAPPTTMAQTVPQPAAGAPSRATPAVLVIDGNEEHQILSVTALGRRGFRVSVADTAREGLRVAAAQRFEVIVLAHKFRDASGLDVLRALHERFPDVPKIFVIPEGGEEIALRALSSGASGYIVKTPRYHELLPTEVEEQIAKTRVQARLEDQQKVLLETQARFQEFVESAGEAIFVLEPSGHLAAFNEAMCKSIGYSREDLMRRPFRDLLSDRADPKAVERLFDAFHGGDAGPVEIAVIRKDGSEVHMSMTPHAVRQGTEIVGVEILARDITERKRAEDDLKNLYGWLNALYRSTSDAIILTDRDLQVFEWNARALGLFQLDEAAMASQNAESLIRILAARSTEPETHLRNYQAYLADPDTALEGDVELTSPEPRVYWRFTTPVFSPDGRLVGRLWTFRDVTERKRAEHELVKREAQLAEAQGLAHLGSWEFDFRTSVMRWSDELYRLFGWDPQSFTPSMDSVLDRTHPDDRNKVMRAFERLRRDESDQRYDHRILLPDGTFRVLHAEGRVVHDDAGRPIRALGTSHDITEIWRAQKIQSATYRISEAANTAESLEDLYRTIHGIVGELMPAANFYIALSDPVTNTLTFPYFADRAESPPGPQRLGRGLTEYVLRMGRPLLASPPVFEDLVRAGEVELVGPPSVDWLGVPLMIQDRTIGALVVQSYTEGVRYGEAELEILGFVSNQIAMAIERRRAAEALRTSEGRFRRLAENAQDLIYRYRLTEPRGFEYVSPAATRLTGYTPEEHYADPELGFKLVHPEDREKLEDLLTHRLANPDLPPEPIFLRWVRKDGTLLWTEQQNVGIFDSRGTLVAVEGIARDVTSRILADQEIRASEERFRLLAKATRDAIWDWDVETDTMIWSEAIGAVLGCPVEDVQPTGAWYDSRIHPEDRERVVGSLWHAVNGGGDSWNAEYRLKRMDSSWSIVSDQALILRDDQGAARRVIGSVTNITEKKIAQDALLARERQQAAVAALGQRALEGRAARELMDEAAALVSKTLAVEYSGVLELQPDGDHLLLRSAAGWPEEAVGKALLPAGHDSQAGYTLLSGGPVVVEDARKETRFRIAAMVRDEDIVSSVSVPIPGTDHPFGVLGALTKRPRKFTEDDIHFLQAVANVLASAIERRRADETLRQSEERYRLLFESNPHPMWAYDIETLGFLAVNDAAVRHYGYSRDEFLAMTIKDIRPAEDTPALLANVSRLRDGVDEAGVWRHRKKDGTVIQVEITSHTLRFGGRRAEIVLAHDITDRLRAREELERSERKFRALFEAAAEAIVLIDRQGNILDINPAGEGLIRRTKDGVIGRNLSEFVPPDELPHARDYLRSLLKDHPIPDPFETSILTPTEERRSVEVRSRVLRESGGETYLELVVRDVTEQREMQRRLLQSERLASMGQLSAYVAHEINTPLTSISLLTASIARRVKDSEVLGKLEKINVQRRHAAAIIADLLTFSKHREVRTVRTELRAVVEGALEQVEVYRKAPVALVNDSGDQPMFVNADPLQLQEVIVNLVKNALEATETGSVRVSLHERPEYVAFVVADTGIGMTREVRAHLFEPFFTTKRPGEGTGLGLPMCHNIVSAHGGRIEVESEPGRGTTFTVLLPKGASP